MTLLLEPSKIKHIEENERQILRQTVEGGSIQWNCWSCCVDPKTLLQCKSQQSGNTRYGQIVGRNES